jgi:hypothetical protein
MADPDKALRQPSQAGIPHLLRNPDLLRLLDYWRSKRRGRPMPSRKDIDPTEIPWALSRVLLVDYSPQDGFRYRLAGADVATAFGRGNMKGLVFSDFFSPERARSVEERWLPIVRDRCIAVMTGMIYFAADRTSIGERVLLPLADDADGPVTGIFGMAQCEWVTGTVPREVRLSQVEYLPIADIP